VALISGIYSRLLQAIQSISPSAIKNLLTLNFQSFLKDIEGPFLVTLGLGIGLSIMGLSHLIHYLLDHFPIYTWSLFFGLIMASTVILGKKIKSWKMNLIFFLTGTVMAYLLVGVIPIQTHNTWWFIIFSGIVSICAMILPGISGSFLLLLMGKYRYITGAVKNPFTLESFSTILLFCVGAFLGLFGFTRILSWFLKKYYHPTLACLTGLMLGSLRKVWPWKITIESVVIRGKAHILQEANFLPQKFNLETFYALVFMLIGFMLVYILETKLQNE